MQVTVHIPEPVAEALGYTTEGLPRRALEALLVDECATAASPEERLQRFWA